MSEKKKSALSQSDDSSARSVRKRKGQTRPAPLGKDSLPEPQHQAWYQMLRAHAKVNRRIEKSLQRAGHIPIPWYDVLVSLEKAPDHRLRMSELADEMVTSRSGLTRIVDRLEEAGYLRREACPGDRRGSYAVLTEAGAQARLQAWPAMSSVIREFFVSHLSDEEAKIIADALRRIADVA